MKPYLAIVTVLVAALLNSCDDAVPLTYSTRADAETETVFARGWLPGIIPTSSTEIRMRNDLDLNISNGEFQFKPSDFDQFVASLKRIPTDDKDGFSAYRFQNWTFWINHEKNFCRFYMRLNTNNS